MKNKFDFHKLLWLDNPWGIGWFAFCVICVTTAIVFACTTDHNQNNDKLYHDVDLIVYSIDQKETVSAGNCHEVIFKLSSAYPALYWVYNTCDKNDKSCGCKSKIHINTEWLYNHKAGDMVHFDYVLKSRFIPSTVLDEKNPIK